MNELILTQTESTYQCYWYETVTCVHGQCVFKSGPVCDCDQGWQGSLCDQSVSPSPTETKWYKKYWYLFVVIFLAVILLVVILVVVKRRFSNRTQYQYQPLWTNEVQSNTKYT